jgi:hypothetical protein
LSVTTVAGHRLPLPNGVNCHGTQQTSETHIFSFADVLLRIDHSQLCAPLLTSWWFDCAAAYDWNRLRCIFQGLKPSMILARYHTDIFVDRCFGEWLLLLSTFCCPVYVRMYQPVGPGTAYSFYKQFSKGHRAGSYKWSLIALTLNHSFVEVERAATQT